MAIRRCPYCKAIIDEQDKYCNNCGTQLLFPEDEFIEEEIPGDKIIDKEESEEAEVREDQSEDKELAAELEEEELIEEEEELGGGESKDAASELEEDTENGIEEERELEAELEEEEEEEESEGSIMMTGQVSGVSAVEDLLEPPGSPVDAGIPAAADGGPERPAADESQEEEPVEETGEEPQESIRGPRPQEPGAWKFGPGGSEKKYEVSIEQDELVFKTKDLEKLTGTVDEGRRELENFLESRADFAARRPAPDTKEGLPPWVSRIRETPATVEPEEAAREEPPPARREWTTDSGIGVPEKITKASLPFGDTGDQTSETTDEERERVDEETEESTDEEKGTQRPVSLSLKLRAKVVDWVFVTALWLISLGFTAQVAGVSFFRLIFGSPFPVLAFYVILLVLYFFLFLYFLGETPGDHYFSEED